LLRPRRNRASRRAAEKRDEVAAVHGQPSSQGTTYHIVKSEVCCASQQKWGRRCLQGVISGKPQIKHMLFSRRDAGNNLTIPAIYANNLSA
jgi:hypothetical protein